jgi:hypothetical protein
VATDDSGQGRSVSASRHRTEATADNADDAGVESNSRLTAATAVVLVVLFAIEGLTVLGVRRYFNIHVFVGMLLIPPVLLKIGSTGWRFARYYRGAAPYRRKGPPPVLMRLLGPVLVVLTVMLLASGVTLVLAPQDRNQLLFIHQASALGWLGVTTIHLLGHLRETARLAPLALVHRTRSQVAGASARQWALIASLAVGAVLGLVMLRTTTHYLGATVAFLHHHHHH